jgi:hypothetical protein
MIEHILISLLRTMETATTFKWIAKNLSKPVERGPTWRRARHPLNHALIVLLEGQSSIKLLDQRNVELTPDLHKLV